MKPQRGAAILVAVFTVAIIAALAASASWLQWRQVEIEMVQQDAEQRRWLMTAGLDWARSLIVAEGGGEDQPTHRQQTWAQPVPALGLNAFLAAGGQALGSGQAAAPAPEAGDSPLQVSVQIEDAQSRINLTSLMSRDTELTADEVWKRLFDQLGLPQAELDKLKTQWKRTAAQARLPAGSGVEEFFMPRTLSQLKWLGVSDGVIEALRPYATILPTATPVNLNTTSAHVLGVVLPKLAAQAPSIVARLERVPLKSPNEAVDILGNAAQDMDENVVAINSRYYDVRVRVWDNLISTETLALVERSGTRTRVVWRTSSSRSQGS